MNEIFEKIYNENNTGTEEDILFEKVYTEAKMLNEMNPKLRKILGSAALAAALGLGTVGCSTPNDDYSEPPAIEQPANPDNPGKTETETPEDTGFKDSEETPETPSDPEFGDPEEPEPEDPEPEEPETPVVEEQEPENPEGPVDSGDTETEDVVTFETLGVGVYADSLARAAKSSNTYDVIKKSSKWISYKYEDKDTGFSLIEDFDIDGEYYPASTCIRYSDSTTKEFFYVPVSMESDFDTAIAAYKAAHAE